MGVADADGGQERTSGPLLERERELYVIGDVIRQALERRGALVVIGGPAGIGKSRLLEAAVGTARQRDLEAFVAPGAVGEQGFPFAVVLRLFEGFVRRAPADERSRLFSGAARLAAPLLASEAPWLEPAVTVPQLFALIHGLYWFVVNLAERAPVLVAVDDAHAVDEPSLRFLLYLSQRLEGLPIAVAVAGRLGEPDARPEVAELISISSASVLHPGPLSACAVGALIEEQLEFAVSEQFIDACAEVTGGNPYLLRELMAALAAEGIDRQSATADRARSMTPAAVSQRLFARLVRLGDGAGALASALSVLGDDVPVELVARLAGLDGSQAARAVDALARVEITHPSQDGKRVSFVHPLVRTALYDDLPKAERAAIHARAASLLLDAGAALEQIVPHVVRGERGANPRAVGLLQEAAVAATARGMPDRAVDFLERALEEPTAAASRALLLLELARVQLAAGDAASAASSSARAARAEVEPGRRASAGLILGRALYAQARHGAAAAAFARGLADLGEDADVALAHELRAAYAAAASLDASLAPRGLAMAQEIVSEHATDLTLSERALLAQLAVKRAWAGAPRDHVLPLAERAWGEGALLAAESADGALWTLVTASLAWCEEYKRDVEMCTNVVESATRCGSVLAFATASFCRTWPLLQLARLDAAIADAEVALDAQRYGWEQHRGSAAAMLSHALLEKGRYEDAAAALAPIEEPEMASRIDYSLLLEARARLALARGEPDSALHDATEAGRLLEEVYSMRNPWVAWRATAALAAATLGDVDRARALLDDDLVLAEGVGAPGIVGRTLRTRGLIERGPRGLALLSDAVSVLEPVAPRLEHIRALVDFGGALRRRDQRRAARKPLERGFELAAHAGAFRLMEQARAELAALGARPRKDMAARDRLTASERRVAEMAARGMTNKQIAQALFVTLKTVEGHLNHAYRKLGITSRSELPREIQVHPDRGSSLGAPNPKRLGSNPSANRRLRPV